MESWGMRLLRSAAFAAVAFVSLAAALPAQAGDVVVFGDRYNLNTINHFYNTYGGHTSAIAGSSIAGYDLTGIELLWAVQPADSYTVAELNNMNSFLANGGRIAFMGEHGTFAPDENNRINAALTALGATMSIVNTIYDADYRTASVGDGQILSDPLTAGVNTYRYAAFAPLTISGTAKALMRGEDDPSTIMMAFQNIGAGSIFLITDQNVWDDEATLWPGYDNEVMFNNLVQGQTGAPPVVIGGVPEPATWAMLLAGFFGLGGALRRRREKDMALA